MFIRFWWSASFIVQYINGRRWAFRTRFGCFLEHISMRIVLTSFFGRILGAIRFPLLFFRNNAYFEGTVMLYTYWAKMTVNMLRNLMNCYNYLWSKLTTDIYSANAISSIWRSGTLRHALQYTRGKRGSCCGSALAITKYFYSTYNMKVCLIFMTRAVRSASWHSGYP